MITYICPNCENEVDLGDDCEQCKPRTTILKQAIRKVKERRERMNIIEAIAKLKRGCRIINQAGDELLLDNSDNPMVMRGNYVSAIFEWIDGWEVLSQTISFADALLAAIGGKVVRKEGTQQTLYVSSTGKVYTYRVTPGTRTKITDEDKLAKWVVVAGASHPKYKDYQARHKTDQPTVDNRPDSEWIDSAEVGRICGNGATSGYRFAKQGHRDGIYFPPGTKINGRMMWKRCDVEAFHYKFTQGKIQRKHDRGTNLPETIGDMLTTLGVANKLGKPISFVRNELEKARSGKGIFPLPATKEAVKSSPIQVNLWKHEDIDAYIELTRCGDS